MTSKNQPCFRTSRVTPGVKRAARYLTLFALLFTTVRAVAQPTITAQPISRTNNVGDNAQFVVTATGGGTLTYRWQFNTVDLAGGASNTLNVVVTDANKAGSYRVLVSDNSNLTNTSSVAVLAVPYGERTKITQWNFNSTTPDNNTGTGISTPSIGAGTLSALGTGVGANGFNSGGVADPATSDNSSRRWSGLATTVANKTGGIQFGASTVGYKSVSVSGELWLSARSSAYWRGFYTTNGIDWTPRMVIDRRTGYAAGVDFVYFSDDLSGVAGVSNNASFAYRVVAEYQSTATGSGSAAYVAVDSAQTYNTSGLFGMDMLTVLAVVDDGTVQPAITTQPQSQTNYVGSTATFTVAATGGGLKYFWQLGGQNITNQTNSSLVIANLQPTNAGDYTVIITNSSGSITSSVAVLTVEAAPPPGDRYWSADGATQGGTGTWDATTPNRWGLAAAGPYPFSWNNNNVDNAILGGASGTVTLAADVTVNKVTSSVNNYSFAGGSTITFSGTGAGVNITGNNLDFNCKLAGPSLTKTGSGQMSLNTSGNTVGKYIVNGGTLGSSVGNLGTPGSLVTDFVTLNGGNLGFEATSVNLGVNRGIYLGASGGLIAAKSGATVTFGAPITGPGGLTFPSSNFGQGNAYGANSIPYIFSNPANDYQGSTTVARGELRLGANDVLPDTTMVTISGANGQLNLNGKTDTVSGVIVNGSGARITDTAGAGILSTAGTFDLRQSGSGSSSVVAILGGSGTVVKTTANTVELSGVNTYTGNTTISAGTLALTGLGSCANSPTIFIASGAILDVTGRTDGTLGLSSSQTLSGAGTVSGAVSVSGTLSPGSGPGALSTGLQTWNGGGAYDWEIASATGAAGTNWDTLVVTGNLDVQATSGNKFTVRLKSLNGSSPGNMANFDNNTAASWTLASVSGSVLNFAPDSFMVNYSAVSNDLAGGSFLIETNSGLGIRFTNNHPPSATTANLTRPRGASWKIKISELLAANTSDADGHGRALVSAGADTAPTRGTVSVANGYIFYSPTNMNSADADSFSFRVKDLAPYRPGDTVREAFANIQLTVTEAYGTSKEIAISGGSVTVQFAGIPGYRYSVERATDANFTENLTLLDTVTAPGDGQFGVTDNAPPTPTGFYRLKYNPL